MFNANQKIGSLVACPQASLSMWVKPLALVVVLLCHPSEAWAWKDCDEDQTADAQQFCSDRGLDFGGCTDEGGGLLYVVCVDGDVPMSFSVDGSGEYPEDHEREDWGESSSDSDDSDDSDDWDDADERLDNDGEFEEDEQDDRDVEEDDDGDTGDAGNDEDFSGPRDRGETGASERRISKAERRASIHEDELSGGDHARSRRGVEADPEGAESAAGCSTTGVGTVHLGMLSLVALLGLARRQESWK